MSTAGGLQLDLQEGFRGDEIVVAADGVEVARVTNVTTRLQLGFARAVTLEAANRARVLSVSLPALGLTATIDLPSTRPLWIGASLSDARDRLDLSVATRRFGYA